MSKTAVCIPTTWAPALILGIENQTDGVDSAIFLKDEYVAQPVKKEYDGLARQVIRKLVGAAHFVLWVSSRIDSGRSFCVPVAIAHVLHADGMLAKGLEGATRLVWATGAIHPVEDQADRFRIEPVGYMDDKLRKSAELFAEATKRGMEIVIVAAKSDLDEAAQLIIEEICPSATLVPCGVNLLTEFKSKWGRAGATVTDTRSRASKARPQPGTNDPAPAKPSRQAAFLAGGAVLAFAGAAGGYLIWKSLEDRPDHAATPRPLLSSAMTPPSPMPTDTSSGGATAATAPPSPTPTPPPAEVPPWSASVRIKVSASHVPVGEHCHGIANPNLKRMPAATMTAAKARSVPMPGTLCVGSVEVVNGSDETLEFAVSGSGSVTLKPGASDSISLDDRFADAEIVLSPADGEPVTFPLFVQPG